MTKNEDQSPKSGGGICMCKFTFVGNGTLIYLTKCSENHENTQESKIQSAVPNFFNKKAYTPYTLMPPLRVHVLLAVIHGDPPTLDYQAPRGSLVIAIW